MIFPVLLILGVAILGVALRSYGHPFLRKLGALCILLTSFLIVYFLSGSWPLALVCALSWLLLPWVEILTRIRRLRLPLEKALRPKRPPSREIFPGLDDLTAEVEGQGFVHVEDAGWDWDDYQQFFRLFYRAEDRAQAAICMNEQGDIAFFYLSVSSRSKDGNIWTTWNYPFSYGLKLLPRLKVNRLRSDSSFNELCRSHLAFLKLNSVSSAQLYEQAPDEMPGEIQRDMRAQIDHNLHAGLLTRADEGQIKYSWRGLVFLWWQFLRDLVRFS